MNSIKFTFILAFITYTIDSVAQWPVKDNNYIISGKIINISSKKGLSFAHIMYSDNRFGIISDSLGFFRIKLYPKQQIIISLIGYQNFIYSDTTNLNDHFVEIEMIEQSYMLEEVNIHSRETYQEFKARISKNILSRQGIRIDLVSIISLFVKSKTPEVVKQIGQSEERILQKYNSKLVCELTNEIGSRLDNLMHYININSNFT